VIREMKKRLVEVMDYLDYEELMRMKQDLSLGGVNLMKVVEDKIAEEAVKQQKFCCTCNSRIDPQSTNNFTLEFGPTDIKRKASFCAIDCLEYFMKNLKDMRKQNEIMTK